MKAIIVVIQQQKNKQKKKIKKMYSNLKLMKMEYKNGRMKLI